MPTLPRLILIADQIAAGGRPLPEVVASAAAGVDGRLIVQLREPKLSDTIAIQLLRAMRRRVPAETVLAVNNRPNVARALDVGLHVPGYMNAPSGEFALRGRSVHDDDQARAAIAEQADYAIVGTIFETASHPGREGAGLAHLSRIAARLAPMPAYAIGGITAENAANCIEAGAWGVAVRGAIMGAPDPGVAAAEILDAILDQVLGNPGRG